MDGHPGSASSDHRAAVTKPGLVATSLLVSSGVERISAGALISTVTQDDAAADRAQTPRAVRNGVQSVLILIMIAPVVILRHIAEADRPRLAVGASKDKNMRVALQDIQNPSAPSRW